ncbi:MAG: hypothetical protein HZB16_00140 [Armatimonadetes bacterium]|nr:hypothetical protein [Armatimonadota bacterium]
MRTARWSLRVVLLAVLAGLAVRAVPRDLRVGLREAIRQPAEATLRVDHVACTPLSGARAGRGGQQWLVTSGDRSFVTMDGQVGAALQAGHTYVLRFHGNERSEQCRLLAVVSER